MKYPIATKTIVLISTFILLSGCKPRHLPASKGGYTYSGIYFGAHFNSTYKQGIRDGCKTAKGVYRKSHWFFQNKQDYVDGWFLGRNKCKKLLKINKDGDLIL
ncbi:MAG TPA: hypothetical protein EYG82_02270 [Sulfurovum sp.]|nr:hypothetical protein [Sulfurovum sp.]